MDVFRGGEGGAPTRRQRGGGGEGATKRMMTVYEWRDAR